MSKPFFSKMLVNVLTISLIFQNAWLSSAKAQMDVISCDSVSYELCSGKSDMLCYDNGYHKVTKCVNKPKKWYRLNSKNKVFHRPLSRKELIEKKLIVDANVQTATLNSTPAGNAGNANGDGGGVPGGSTTTTTTTTNCVVTHTCRTDTYSYSHSSGSSDHWAILKDQCPYLIDLVGERQNELDTLRSEIKRDEKKLDELRAKLKSDMEACHETCFFAVVNDKSECYYKKVKKFEKKRKEVIKYLDAQDLALTDADVKKFTDDAQAADGVTTATGDYKSDDRGELCSVLVKDSKCLEWMIKEDKCDDSKADMQAFADLKKKVDGNKAREKVLADEDTTGCKISRYSPPSGDYKDKSVACLQMLAQTCDDYFAQLDAAHSEECVDCNSNSSANPYANQQVCFYGPCPPGVSKAAQIIGAIGSLAVPLGLGAMNMSMYNRGLSACTAAYALQVQQATYVGLPPMPSQCGIGGFGMGGFMGGLGGMGGMGMNPFMMGGMGMSPISMMAGLGGLGLNAGLSLGLGLGGMNPMMMGGMNPMMTGGMNPMGSYMNIQQQMMDSQIRMQEMAAMAMTAQTAYGMGYPNMTSAWNMPYYGMGSNPMMFNPMMNNGLYLNAGASFGNPYGNMMNPYGSGCGYYMAGIPCQ